VPSIKVRVHSVLTGKRSANSIVWLFVFAVEVFAPEEEEEGFLEDVAFAGAVVVDPADVPLGFLWVLVPAATTIFSQRELQEKRYKKKTSERAAKLL